MAASFLQNEVRNLSTMGDHTFILETTLSFVSQLLLANISNFRGSQDI